MNIPAKYRKLPHEEPGTEWYDVKKLRRFLLWMLMAIIIVVIVSVSANGLPSGDDVDDLGALSEFSTLVDYCTNQGNCITITPYLKANITATKIYDFVVDDKDWTNTLTTKKKGRGIGIDFSAYSDKNLEVPPSDDAHGYYLLLAIDTTRPINEEELKRMFVNIQDDPRIFYNFDSFYHQYNATTTYQITGSNSAVIHIEAPEGPIDWIWEDGLTTTGIYLNASFDNDTCGETGSGPGVFNMVDRSYDFYADGTGAWICDGELDTMGTQDFECEVASELDLDHASAATFAFCGRDLGISGSSGNTKIVRMRGAEWDWRFVDEDFGYWVADDTDTDSFTCVNDTLDFNSGDYYLAMNMIEGEWGAVWVNGTLVKNCSLAGLDQFQTGGYRLTLFNGQDESYNLDVIADEFLMWDEWIGVDELDLLGEYCYPGEEQGCEFVNITNEDGAYWNTSCSDYPDYNLSMWYNESFEVTWENCTVENITYTTYIANFTCGLECAENATSSNTTTTEWNTSCYARVNMTGFNLSEWINYTTNYYLPNCTNQSVNYTNIYQANYTCGTCTPGTKSVFLNYTNSSCSADQNLTMWNYTIHYENTTWCWNGSYIRQYYHANFSCANCSYSRSNASVAWNTSCSATYLNLSMWQNITETITNTNCTVEYAYYNNIYISNYSCTPGGAANCSCNCQPYQFSIGGGTKKMGINLIIGVGIVVFLLLYLVFKLDDKHAILKFLVSLFAVGFLILIPYATIAYNDDCTMMTVNETAAGNLTTYGYDYICAESTLEAPGIFLRGVLWLGSLFLAYIFLYSIWEIFGVKAASWLNTRRSRWRKR